MSVASTLVVFGAGLVAGLINSVAGGGTLLSFPVLVWLGRDPIVANITNTVALWPGSLASAVGFRRELRGGRRLLVLLAIPSVLGALTGATLLMRTSSRTFAVIVPYLILFATFIFAAQGPITRRLRRRHQVPPSTPAPAPPEPAAALSDGERHGTASALHRDRHIGASAPRAERHGGANTTGAALAGAMLFQFVVAIYGGYFGAGIGIIMLAALGLLGVTDILHMNGLKNAFAFCINAVAAAYFALHGNVSWLDAIVLGVGAITGGYVGAGVARRVGRATVRRAVIVIGFAMAASLLWRHP